MNLAWFSATSRWAAIALTSTAIGGLAWGGCGGGGDGYGCTSVPAEAGIACTSSNECPPGDICTTNGSCVPKCTSSASCPKGTICKSDQCIAPMGDAGKPVECSTSADCKIGQTCNKEHNCVACGAGDDAGLCACTTKSECAKGQECYKGDCVTCGGTSGPCPCAASSDCSTGDVCVSGSCEPSTTVCKFSSQCAANEVCDDGKCVPSCGGTSGACATGFTCSSKNVCEPNPGTGCKTSADCKGSDPVCVAGTCAPACTTDSQCPTGDYCDQGACVVDTRPKPNCMTNKDCLSTDGGPAQQCIAGYCEYTCKTDNDCELIDARIGTCSGGICKSSTEAMPMCTSQADCPTGKDCISNTCQ